MTEKEIIKRVKHICNNWYDENLEIDVKWLQGLLDLYNKEKRKTRKALDYIEENSFSDTTGDVLNLQDESYWKLWKILKGDE